MVSKQPKSPIIVTVLAAIGLLLAMRLRHPLFILAAIVLSIMAYNRFRTNLIAYRRKQFHEARRDTSIDVEATEIKEQRDLTADKDRHV
jgi:predicted membrane chloride channel (bestrophin family)